MTNHTRETVVIKKYPNRRLYNTQTSVYVTLDDLYKMVRKNEDFQVQDAKTGEDLTRQTLTQIILEQENKGEPLLPAEFLRSVICFYDDNMRDVLQHYLSASMRSFIQNQDKMRSYVGKAMREFSPLSTLEEMTRQNVAIFERAFSMFNPFAGLFSQSAEERKESRTGRRKREN